MRATLTQRGATQPAPSNAKAPWLDKGVDRTRLLEDWWFDVDGVPFVVPAGYVTDWASIPEWIEWLYPRDSMPFRPAALLHDYLYSHLWPLYSKRFADQVFRELLRQAGVPVWRRWAFWCAVRAGGRGGWHYVKNDAGHPFWRAQYRRVTGCRYRRR